MTKNLKKKTFGKAFFLFLTVIPYAFPSVYADNLPAFLSAEERRNIKVFNQVSAAVVNISSTALRQVGFFNFNVTEVPAGSGSGFVWDNRGHIVTNYHVVQNAIKGRGKVNIIFKNGDSVRARPVGVAPKKDIAVLKVRLPKNLQITPLPVADSSKLLVGQIAMAVGSPFGLDQTFTRGVVSALGREIDGIGGVTIKGVIQTDASINPGNSGGPLLDSRGHLMGINTAIYSKSGAYDGIGFAVPSNTISRIVKQLIRYGRVREPSLGVTYFDESISYRLGIKGLIVKSVVRGTGADEAGIRGTTQDRRGNIILGDIIRKINGVTTPSYDALYSELDKMKIGDYVTVKILRGKREKTVKIRLDDIGNESN